MGVLFGLDSGFSSLDSLPLHWNSGLFSLVSMEMATGRRRIARQSTDVSNRGVHAQVQLAEGWATVTFIY